MVVIRESPRAHPSPSSQNIAQWPPNSPLQALLSSPSGRKKWQDRQSRRDAERSPSPSPVVRRNIMKELGEDEEGEEEGEEEEGEEEEEEDEETLQLQLHALQTKIKLNRLKAKRRRETMTMKMMPPPPTIQVPTSPVRREPAPEEQEQEQEQMRLQLQLSPARRRLGLTSNPRAEDISLKRARDQSSFKRAQSGGSTSTTTRESARPLSFNERLAETKEKASLRQAKQDRLSALRSTAFSNKPSSTTTTGMTAISDESPRQKAARARQRARDITQNSLDAQSGVRTGHASLSSSDEDEDSLNIDHNDSEGYDPFSKIHLKKRHIPHPVVAREMLGKEIYPLPRLLKEVKSPDYDPPDCESDFVVFAVLASKSSPLDHATTHKTTGDNPLQPAKNKFMVLKLVDLKWEIDCFLFGTAFTHFWKLTPGTLLAILNPSILPPKGNQHNGRFSLKLGSSEDAVMEIGVARDLALCSAMKKDGQGCGEWVDKRKTEACEFHVSLMVDKARKHRMEVNTMFRDPDGNKDDRTKSRAARGGSGGGGGKRGVGNYSREYGMLYSVPRSVGAGRSTASAMDRDDTDALHGLSKEEASRKRIAKAQKERDLARSLGELGNGVGAAYLKASTQETAIEAKARCDGDGGGGGGGRERNRADAAREELFKKPSVRELGLLGNLPEGKRLSPPRERKSHFGLGLMTRIKSNHHHHHHSTTVGWSGASRASGIVGRRKEVLLSEEEKGQTRLEVPTTTTTIENNGGRAATTTTTTTTTKKNSRPRSQESSSLRSQRSASPLKKRARLLIPGKEGIVREPGRESSGATTTTSTTAAAGRGCGGEGSDDELEIV